MEDEIPVGIVYTISDGDGNTVLSDGETITAKGDVSFSKRFTLEGIPGGEYVLKVAVKYEGSLGTATEVFEIRRKEVFLGPVRMQVVLYVSIFALIAGLLSFSVFFYKKIKTLGLRVSLPARKVGLFSKRRLLQIYRGAAQRMHRESALRERIKKKIEILEQGHRDGIISDKAFAASRARLLSLFKKK